MVSLKPLLKILLLAIFAFVVYLDIMASTKFDCFLLVIILSSLKTSSLYSGYWCNKVSTLISFAKICLAVVLLKFAIFILPICGN
ncbi:hypothetical protein D3C81_1071650 [compost metagenome]